MDNIGLKDIISLALKGYKPGDIKELIEIAKSCQIPDGGNDEEYTEENEQPAEPSDSDVSSEVTKEMIIPSDSEQLKAEIISLQEKIKALQSENINKEVSAEIKTDEEKFEDLVKNFF